MFSIEVATCWPRNSKREITAPTLARASETRSIAVSMVDKEAEAAPAVVTEELPTPSEAAEKPSTEEAIVVEVHRR